MKHKFAILLLLVFLASCMNNREKSGMEVPYDLNAIEERYETALKQLSDSTKLPRSYQSGKLNMVKPNDWTSGFFPGCLWLIHELTGKDSWRTEAEKWCRLLESQQHNDGTHDLGFMMFCSFGNGYRLYKSDTYHEILLTTANTLSSRYNDTVKCIRSWDWGEWEYPVIIDNMMNLELLMWALKNGGTDRFYDIAVNHADRTMANHYRDDYSTWHVLDYDPGTGQVLSKVTHQGHSDESEWARGQAWGLYGYTMMYRETGLKRYLDQAESIAHYLDTHPARTEDGIPYWDFDAPDIPDAPRDASAAAITCSALLELYTLTGKSKDSYLAEAEAILRSLCSEEYFSGSWEENGPFLIKHCVGNKPKEDELDVGINYADYYFLESVLRYRRITQVTESEQRNIPGTSG